MVSGTVMMKTPCNYSYHKSWHVECTEFFHANNFRKDWKLNLKICIAISYLSCKFTNVGIQENKLWCCAFQGTLYVLLGPKQNPLVTRHDWEMLLNLWPAIVRTKPSEKLSVIRLMENIVETVHKHFPTITISLQVSVVLHRLAVQPPAMVVWSLLFVPTDTRTVPWCSTQALEVKSSSMLLSCVRRGGCCWLRAVGRQEPLQLRSVPSSAGLCYWCHGAWKLVSRWKMPVLWDLYSYHIPYV